MVKTRAIAAEQGYVETIFGRRLYLPEIKASNLQRRQAAERTAINAPMQGSAADIIKRAMISVDEWLRGSDLDTRMTMQVHDELVLEVPEARLDEVTKGVEIRMCAAAELSIPLVVEVGVGDNWDEAHWKILSVATETALSGFRDDVFATYQWNEEEAIAQMITKDS